VCPGIEVDYLAGKLPSCAFFNRHMDSAVGTKAQNSGSHKILVSKLLGPRSDEIRFESGHK
jgi:hypothetical protein